MKLKLSLFFVAITISLSMCVGYLFSNGNASPPPAQMTNAPGEGNCTSCHSGALNSGGGSAVLVVNGGATTYTAGGAAIPVTITVADATQTRFGFEVTALDASNNAAGTFTALVGTSITSAGGRNYVYHSVGVTNAAHTNTWTFNWTPPATAVGNITFYAVGNAANGNTNSSGDHIYTTTTTLTPPSGAPVASYTHTFSNGLNATTVCSGDTVTFTNTSTGTNGTTTYAWDVDFSNNGGGTIVGLGGHQVSAPGPIKAIYTNTGTTPVVYITGLIVSNGMIPTFGVNADSQSHLIVVYPKAPAPLLSATMHSYSYCMNEIDTLTITNPALGVTYTMNFGLATQIGTGGVNGPYYIQLPNINGMVPISCTAAYPLNTCTSTANLTPGIYAQTCITTANFFTPKVGPGPGSPVPSSYCNGTAYYYTDSSYSAIPIISYNWNFGVGSVPPYPVPAIASGPGPHGVTYPLGGIYLVKETLVDIIGQVAVDSHYVTILSCGVTPLTSSINISGATTHCIGKVDSLADVSFGGTATINSWNWDYGDATPHGTGPIAYHNYANPGTYQCTLIVGNGVAFDTSSITIIVVGHPTPNVANNDTICAGSSLPIGGAVTAGYTYSWFPSTALSPNNSSPNPTASPTVTTTYYETVVEPLAGCTATDSIKVTVSGVPSLAITSSATTSCYNAAITLTCNPANAGTYTWNFSGATVISGSGGGPYQVSWPAAGTQTVSASVIDNFGCTASSNNVTINIQNCVGPIAGFTVPGGTLCTSSPITFTDASLNTPSTWSWNFGSGAIPAASIQQNPNVTFSTAGPHIVTLIVSNSGGSSSFTDTITITQTPTSNFQVVTPACVNVGTLINYNGTATAAATFNWNFNGGIATPSSGPGPISCYWVSSGTQPVSLTVSENGCTSQVTINNVVVNSNPLANFTHTVGSGLLVSFHNTSSGASSYNWSGADNFNSTLSNPIHTYSGPGNYQVCLMAINGVCSTQKCDTIAVDFPSGIVPAANSPLVNLIYYTDYQLLLIDQVNLNDLHSLVQLYNVNGELVRSYKIDEAKVSLSLADLAAGMYMVQLMNSQTMISKKLLIAH